MRFLFKNYKLSQSTLERIFRLIFIITLSSAIDIFPSSGIPERLYVNSIIQETIFSNQNDCCNKNICKITMIYKDENSVSLLLCFSYRICLKKDLEERNTPTLKLLSIYLGDISKCNNLESFGYLSNKEELLNEDFVFLIYEIRNEDKPIHKEYYLQPYNFEHLKMNNLLIPYKIEQSIDFLIFNLKFRVVNFYLKKEIGNKLTVKCIIRFKFYGETIKERFGLILKDSLANDLFILFENTKSEYNEIIRNDVNIKEKEFFRYPTEEEKESFIRKMESIILNFPEKEKLILENIKTKLNDEDLNKDEVINRKEYLKIPEIIEKKDQEDIELDEDKKIFRFCLLILIVGIFATFVFIGLFLHYIKQIPKL